MKESTRLREISIPIVVVVLAALLRLYGLGRGLPQLYEEATPLVEAWEMFGWGAMDDLDLNPHFFNYPSLTMYLQLAGQALLFAAMKLSGAIDSALDFQVKLLTDRTPLILTGRFITALFGIATVWLVYILGKRCAGRWGGAAAAFLLAVSTFHIEKSQVIEVDVPMTFFVLLALLFAVRISEEPALRNYLLCGMATGLAISTKYTAAILVLPILAAHILARRGGKRKQKPEAARRIRKSRKTKSTNRQKSTKPLQRAPWKYAAYALCIAVLAFFVTSPFVFLDAPTFYKHFSQERQHMRFGHFGLETSGTFLFYLQSLSKRLLGWPLALLALAGLLYLAALRRHGWAIVCASFTVPLLAAVSTWAMKADRYILPVLPLLMIFASATIVECLGRSVFAVMSDKRRLAVGGAATLLAAVPLFAALPGHFALLRPDTRTVAKEWIESNIPSGSFIVTEAYGPELLGPHVLLSVSSEARTAVMEKVADIPNYAIQRIPMFQVKPERSEVFYDLSLYDVADVFITSGAVRSRYEREPRRFQRQIGFYDSLETYFEKVHELTPEHLNGPTIVIYRNPRHAAPFGKRTAVEYPHRLRHTSTTVSGSEEFFYVDLGQNYESFGYTRQALASYELGFQFPIFHPEERTSLVLGKTRCLLALRRQQEAADFLRREAEVAATRSSRDHFLRLRREILAKIRTQ